MAAVSVLMPVYNADTFIKETMDSILSQTFQDFELLVMDDGSTDTDTWTKTKRKF
jgi:glycosyltransferase involved in cell wall biosynthesis